MINVLVVSPTPALRAGLRALLAGDPDLLVSTASGLADAPGPQMAGGTVSGLLDGDAPETGAAPWSVVVATQGGVDLANLGLQPEQSLLLVTDDMPEALALAGLELRAWGVISPETNAEALQAAVRALAEGLVAASPEVLRPALAAATAAARAAAAAGGEGALGFPPGADADGPIDPLTERENDVLLRMAQGLTNKQIALALGISEHTVKFHVSSIYSKLGVSNRTEAVRKGARRGWVPL